MAQIHLTVSIPNGELDEGWAGDLTELSESVKATLHELIGDDGGAYVPTVVIHNADLSSADGPRH